LQGTDLADELTDTDLLLQLNLKDLRMRKGFFALGQVCALAATLGAWNASAETRYVAAGQDLQAALDAAQPGDTVLLQAGATFVGNFVLPVKSGSAYITVTTESLGFPLPGPGERISPSHAPGLAKLRSPNSMSVVKTAPRAHHWRFALVEFQANNDGYGDIIRLGDGNQTSLDDVPYELEFDRVYIHGDPLVGQKRGISLQSASTRIVNSYIADIKAVGMDTQAICGWNGPGPYLIQNNYLEGAGENVMFGGADPAIVGLVPSDITFRSNHVRKPIEWRQGIIGTPGGVSASALAGGVLPPGSYTYRVAARRPAGQGTSATSVASPALPVSVSTGGVRVTWNAVPGATEYRVYRLTGTSWQFWTVTSPSFDDTGTAGSAGVPPASATLWSVKNLFEVKNARRLLLEGNVFEYNWHASQTGYAILLKSWNEGGTAPWSTAQDITFTRNIVRHVASAFNILGYSYIHPSTPARNISITHNLIYDVDSSFYGGDGRFVMLGAGPENVTVDHNTVMHTGSVIQVGGAAALGFRYTNNLSRHNAYGFKGDGTAVGNGTIATYFPDGVVTRNVLAGGNAGAYPPGNEFPTVDAFLAEFADDSYRLRPDSEYRNAGTDGLDLGADVEDIWARADQAIRGTASSNAAPVAAPGGPYTGSTLTPITFDGTASVDPDGAILSYVWNWSDGSGESYGPVVTHTFVSAGTYTVTLTVVDDAGASGNATAAVTVVDRTPVDFQVTAISVPVAGKAGGTLTIMETTANAATGTSPATTTAFYLSGDVVLDASDTLLGERVVPPLAAGGSSQQITSVQLPPTLAPGAYEIFAQVDPQNDVIESVEHNNVRSRSIAIGPDLTVTALTGPSVASPGSSISMTDTVANTGADAAAPTTTRFYLSTNGVLDAYDVMLSGSRAVPALEAGAASTGTTPVVIPAATVAGAYFVFALSDAEGRVFEASETNNVRSLVIQIEVSGLASDLVITSLKAPLRAAPGGTIALSDSTTNQGIGVSGPSVTAFYLSRNSLLDAADVRLGAGRAIPSLAPGSSSSGTTGVLVPGDITPGSWYLLVAADAEGVVAETQENNNVRSVFLLVGPDLQVTSISGVGPSTAGGVATVTDTIANRGAGSAGASRVTYYLSANVILDAADQLLAGSRYMSPLPAGASSSGSTGLAIPAGTAPGNYFILAVADGDNQVAESSETNNTTARGIEIQ
jgi:subtilase family serine protease